LLTCTIVWQGVVARTLQKMTSSEQIDATATHTLSATLVATATHTHSHTVLVVRTLLNTIWF
jgi:hypothetical protein